MTQPGRVFATDGEAEAYLVFHEQGRPGLSEQFPRAAAGLLAAWQARGLILDDQFGERAVRDTAAGERDRMRASSPARLDRVLDLHRPGRRPAPRDLD